MPRLLLLLIAFVPLAAAQDPDAVLNKQLGVQVALVEGKSLLWSRVQQVLAPEVPWLRYPAKLHPETRMGFHGTRAMSRREILDQAFNQMKDVCWFGLDGVVVITSSRYEKVEKRKDLLGARKFHRVLALRTEQFAARPDRRAGCRALGALAQRAYKQCGTRSAASLRYAWRIPELLDGRADNLLVDPPRADQREALTQAIAALGGEGKAEAEKTLRGIGARALPALRKVKAGRALFDVLLAKHLPKAEWHVLRVVDAGSKGLRLRPVVGRGLPPGRLVVRAGDTDVALDFGPPPTRPGGLRRVTGGPGLKLGDVVCLLVRSAAR